MYGVSSEVKQQQHRYVTALDLISHWTLLKLGQDISAVFVCSDTTENRTAPVLSPQRIELLLFCHVLQCLLFFSLWKSLEIMGSGRYRADAKLSNMFCCGLSLDGPAYDYLKSSQVATWRLV